MEEVLMKRIVAVTTFSLTLVLACLSVAAQNQTESRDDVIKQIEAKRAELAVLEKKVLAPADTDQEEFAAFLTQPQTGVIRLLPRETYDTGGKRALAISGGGAFYSFVRSTHEYGQGSDIALEQGQLGVGGFGGFDYGLFLNLGDVSLDQVTPEHPAVRALLEYKPATKEGDARHEHRNLWQGINLSDFMFKSRLPAKVSNTYLLRSISYERSDIAAVVRVTRQDTDGSLILVFKVLKKFPAPKAERTQIAEN
jgi:hypothetical protein